MKLKSTLPILLALSACSDAATQNANALSSTTQDGLVTGTYNPTGWTSQEVQKFTRLNCPSGEFASFEETPQPNGLIAFEAACV